jgi:hypothetical protein
MNYFDKINIIKLYSGQLKLNFSIFITPIVILFFYQDSITISISYNLNVILVLIAGVFFTLDGVNDIFSSFQISGYDTESKVLMISNGKYNFLLSNNYKYIIFKKLINRYIFSLLFLTSVILLFFYTIFHMTKEGIYINLNESYFITLLRCSKNGVFMILDTFGIGWILIFGSTSKKIVNIVRESEKYINDNEYITWNNLIVLTKYQKVAITYFPLALCIFYLAATTFFITPNQINYTYEYLLEILIAPLFSSTIIWVLIRKIQRKLFKKFF